MYTPARPVLACLLFLSVAASPAPVVLSRDTVLVVTAADRADPAFALALADLRRDFYRVLGSPAVVLSTVPPTVTAAAPAIVLGAAGRALLLQGDRCVTVHEAHCVVLRGSALVATGAPGSLGSVYGLYSLSERVLGVPPLHYFADLPP